VGPVKTLTVNFLSPLFGVSGGVLLLGEPVTANMITGTAVILAGTALVLRGGR
jgi:drug/metabolite transporter (DMT)-like permease